MASNKNNPASEQKPKTVSATKAKKKKGSRRLNRLKKLWSVLTGQKGARKKSKAVRRRFTLSPLTWLACAMLVAGLVAVGFLVLYYPTVPQLPPATAVIYQQIPHPQPVEPVPPTAVTPVRPQLAIIMDDLGINLQIAEQALALDIPVALAILPDQRHSQQIMHRSHEMGQEILIHIPMEPISYPDNDPGPMGLFLNQDRDTIQRQIKRMIARFPLAVGGNNHMGSAFTQQADKMEPVLLAMKEAGLFFVDSLTSSRSIAYQHAQRLGLSTGVRDVFLDNVREVEAIQQQLQLLLDKARSNGSAIGICHPYPQTIIALQMLAKQAELAGIDVVPISQLVQ